MKILFIIGTRPEAIKLAPLIKETLKYSTILDVKIAVTGQHREMLDQVLKFFKIKPDYDLNIMRPNQDLFDITIESMLGIKKVIDDYNPHLIIVQGDTTTVFAGALSAFYKNCKLAHLEAGLRSGNKHSPFPEEINRILCSHLADYHWAPTVNAKQNLIKEGIDPARISITQNTVIDSLFLALQIIKEEGDDEFKKTFSFLNFNKKIILLTTHRRENFGLPFMNICKAIQYIATKRDDIEIVYPVHPNPNIHDVAYDKLGSLNNVHLIKPLDYPALVWIMQKSYMVLTDSGGIQEEAPSLGKPVLVLREVTERQEGVDAGTALLVGTNTKKITENILKLLDDNNFYKKISKAINPYGDGLASKRILDLILKINQ